MFFSRADANARLGGTLVLYKGEPVHVYEVVGNSAKDFAAVIVPLTNNAKDQVVPLDKDLFDFRPVPLGYCNYLADAIYLSRIPRRQWKQGLHVGILEATVNGKRYGKFNTATICLADTVRGKYPSLSDAFNTCEKDRMNSCAFSRLFSINKNRILTYKGRDKVGYFDSKLKTFKLEEDFFFLKELVQESIR